MRKRETEKMYSFRAVVEGPERFVYIHLVAKSVWKGRPLGDRGSNRGLEEVHDGRPRDSMRKQSAASTMSGKKEAGVPGEEEERDTRPAVTVQG